MELILQGWLDTDDCGNIGLKYSRNDYSWNCKSLSYLIMDYFDHMRIDEGLGRKLTTIEDAHLSIWFSDEECILEEAQMNFESYVVTGNLLTQGHYVGYSEHTITGFNVDDLIIGGHNLDYELKQHIGQYIHFILTD